jgi:hypothetical protein
MSLAKNLGGRVGVKEEVSRGPKNFLKKWLYKAKKSKKSS